ncbi:NAD(P)/FAD-dependent oxidoreductase [Fictibacillus enclensis]|uniref:NADH dehydrogenase n=1 Tax=Fictibacillus enclensis TaxID=1017270 RepID=A0A0V8J8V5_9BACL|nr:MULTISPECIES: NAD(P)/FAD-dependent oxidoreductase [Fictibacillus]KSU83433.1 NADH dehydrogenase [Fictibacillus enclensis]MDM5200343.1 NAD(P)/FAD-dependent oxidoreductase [Fictibacillus enclensis]MDM5339671.1 NAD(P)/FAD-dependent oxidoreductase [Fictibacillus enclensis]RXZ02251.1 NAD(P)/FAD-dependent oxidoreductase [Fictibacillus sp. S7]WHY71125.1 NAD(P)/FAD-dependent oxidoreductase [Fictibacillus enclensis]
MSKPKILIIGGGYGGMMSAVRLEKELGLNNAEITLVNKHNYHYQTTWLHENAAGTLHHDRTRIMIDDIIDTNKINFVQDTVVEIKKDEKRVILQNGELTYDYLVIALGSDPETFGIQGLKENAMSIRSINSVREIREHIDYNFARYNNEGQKQELINIVVGGAGFTGIEFVGELADRVPELCKEYDIPREKVRIINIEAAPNVLPGFDEELVEYAINNLERRGVEFLVNTPIKECNEDGVLLASGEEIKAATVVWTGGVRGNHLVEEAGFETMRGRVKVDKDLRMPGYEYIFVVGDCALIINEEINRPYPPTAQIAIQQAYTLARNLKTLINGGGKMEEFTFDNKGTVASLGKGEAIGVVGNKKLFGSTASAMKKVIDNRYLFLLGGVPMVVKKGKLKLF